MPDLSTVKSFDAESYRRWLRMRSVLSRRAVYDIISRTRRVLRMTSLRAAASEAEVRYLLEQSSEYKDCSPTVRSQLKRAANLYRSFLAETGAGESKT